MHSIDFGDFWIFLFSLISVASNTAETNVLSCVGYSPIYVHMAKQKMSYWNRKRSRSFELESIEWQNRIPEKFPNKQHHKQRRNDELTGTEYDNAAEKKKIEFSQLFQLFTPKIDSKNTNKCKTRT